MIWVWFPISLLHSFQPSGATKPVMHDSPGTPTSPLLPLPLAHSSPVTVSWLVTGFMAGYWFHGWLLLWVELCPLQEIYRLPRWFSGKESTCQSRRPGFDPWVGKMPWRRKWHPTPVFLPGESHRGAWRATVHGVTKESDTPE